MGRGFRASGPAADPLARLGSQLCGRPFAGYGESAGGLRGIRPRSTRPFGSGAYRDRTGDLRLAKPALSQLS